jgi:signal transduction histidine kinase/FixJ family two-component response regulator
LLSLIDKSTILIVEDNPDNIDVITSALASESYQLEIVMAPQEALERVARVTPDLLLLDVMLPQMDGFMLLERLRQFPELAEVPAIFQSALNDQDSAVRGLESGAIDFLSKPLRERELRTKVRLHLEAFHAKRTIVRQQQQLEEQISWFQHSVETAGLTTFRLDLQTKEIELVPAMKLPSAVLKRVTLGGFLRQLQGMLPEDEYAHVSQMLLRCAQEKVSDTALFRQRGQAIRWQELRVEYQPEHNALIGSLLDVTNYQQLPEKLRKQLHESITRQQNAEDALVRSAKLASLGEVAASIAHELKSPLSAMYLKTQIMQRYLQEQSPTEQGPLPRKVEDLLKINQKITALLQQVQNFAHQSESKTPVECHLPTVAQNVELLVNPDLKRHGIQLKLEFSRELAPVLGHETQLEQVLVNLINNARDALHGCTRKVITIRGEPNDAEVVIQVQDTGKGMPPAVQARLFESFFTTKERGQGTGLGMGIVQRIVQEHNGHISVESEMGHGTTVTLTLPTAAPPQGAGSAESLP